MRRPENLKVRPVATICHNDDDRSDPKHRRVVLFQGSDGYVWARAPREKLYRTDVEVGDEWKNWGIYPGWDFKWIGGE